VLERFSRDKKLSAEERKAFADAVRFEKEWRKVRAARAKLTLAAKAILPSALAAAPPGPPHVTVFDSRHGTSLPGASVPNPGSSSDGTAKRAFVEAAAVADFYQTGHLPASAGTRRRLIRRANQLPSHLGSTGE
jgi:hypothetical protein